MGSIHLYRNASGKRVYRISYRKPYGTQATLRGFRTKFDAEIRLAEVEISKNRGSFVDPADARILIVDLGDDWVASRRADLKPSTFRTLESAWRIHVRPKWGARAVGGLRHSEIQMSVTRRDLEDAGEHFVRTLSRKLHTARGVHRDAATAKARAYLTHEQVAQLAAEAARPELIVFLAYTGLRWGEATGLRVKHVDLQRRRVSVEENAVEVGSFIEVGTPKTHEKRQVPYPAFFAETMQSLVAGKGRDDIVFGEGRIHVRRPKATTGWFNSAVKRAQEKSAEAIGAALAAGKEPPRPFPRVTPHDLRHTAASLAISAGANVKAVQRMLGHASAAMTLDTYADLLDDDFDAVSSALDEAVTAAGIAAAFLPRPERSLREAH
jgi:integrase